MGGVNKKACKCICVGLDNSGKSTIINHLKPEKEKKQESFPTVGFQAESFKHGSMNFTMWDMSGQGRYRNLWENFYQECQGIVFVIDSADTVRMCVVKDELDTLLQHKDIMKRPIPIIFFANKMDLPKSLTPAQVSEALELSKLNDRPWHIVASNALNGSGLEEGVKWLEEHVQTSK